MCLPLIGRRRSSSISTRLLIEAKPPPSLEPSPRRASIRAVNEPAHNYTRTTYGGATVNQRTRDMLEQAARIYGHAFTLTQGSYHPGSASSAGTHDGGGVVDVSVDGMTSAERDRAVQALRRVGFFAWLRTPPSFAYHIHAVAIGDRELSPAAKRQVPQGFADHDGLADQGPDPAPDPYPAWTRKYGTHVSPDPNPDEIVWYRLILDEQGHVLAHARDRAQLHQQLDVLLDADDARGLVIERDVGQG